MGLKHGPLAGLVAVTRVDKRCGGAGGEGGQHCGSTARGRMVTNQGSAGKQRAWAETWSSWM